MWQKFKYLAPSYDMHSLAGGLAKECNWMTALWTQANFSDAEGPDGEGFILKFWNA